jgi:hypothetical protein
MEVKVLINFGKMGIYSWDFSLQEVSVWCDDWQIHRMSMIIDNLGKY